MRKQRFTAVQKMHTDNKKTQPDGLPGPSGPEPVPPPRGIPLNRPPSSRSSVNHLGLYVPCWAQASSLCDQAWAGSLADWILHTPSIYFARLSRLPHDVLCHRKAGSKLEILLKIGKYYLWSQALLCGAPESLN